MSKDNSLVIANDQKGVPTVVGFGSDWPGEDGTFDRHKVAGGYVRIQPGQKVDRFFLSPDASKQAHDFVTRWIHEHGDKGGVA